MARRQSDWRVEQQRFARAEAAAQERQRRARERALAAERRDAERERKQARAAQAQAETHALEARARALSELLSTGVVAFPVLELAALRRDPGAQPLVLGADERPVEGPVWREPAPPGVFASWFGGRGRRDREREAAAVRFEQERRRAEDEEAARQARVGRRRREHAEQRRAAHQAADEHNKRLEGIEVGARARRAEAVRQLAELVLDRVPLPAGFPRRHEVLSSPDGGQLVVRWQLPGKAVVPKHRAVQYVPTKDETRRVSRPAREAAALYRAVVAPASLLVVRSLLVSDPGLSSVTFSGHVDTVDPATGADAYPCLLSLVVERDALPPDENLTRDGFDPAACVTALGALVSAHPYAHEPVEPFLDFDLTRFAFIEGLDAVSTLDSRHNLLEISPSLFEHLVRQVLMQKGDEGWTTTESNDSGIDAVLTNRSTIMGGLSVVQAKRYKPSVKIGPAHIRELAGAMEEKKAGWGILVTTSSSTAGSQQKAREHGRMQLISGDELRWLIKERTGKDVLIG